MSGGSQVRTRLLLAILAIPGIFILAAPAPAPAQTLYGSVVGVTKDAQGAVMPGATVTLVNSGTGLKRETVTDSQGAYNFVNVLAGTYDVRVGMSGFRESVRTGVPVTVGQISRVDITLEIGAIRNDANRRSAALVAQPCFEPLDTLGLSGAPIRLGHRLDCPPGTTRGSRGDRMYAGSIDRTGDLRCRDELQRDLDAARTNRVEHRARACRYQADRRVSG